MVSPIARVKELQVYIDSLTEFVGGVALSWSALAAKDHAQYQKGLSGILSGAEALRKHLDSLKGPFDELRAKSTATRSSALLASATMVREALVAYEKKPADALVPAPGGDPEKPVPVGFSTAQRWVDLVSQIKSGEWAEAREREKWNEYAIAVFAFGPAGIVYVLAKEMGVVPDVGAALAALDKKLGISEELEKQKENLDKIWFGVKVAAGVTAGIASLFGIGYLVRSFRGNGAG